MTNRAPVSHRSRNAIGAMIGSLAAVMLVPAATAHADSASTVTVVGTSDVFDSDLIQNVIKPDFEAAYPQYSLNYVSQGTGAAIAYAEAGTASALLVHAASVENQFVQPPSPQVSYSAEQYGRAIFYGDYVLLGPASDPAGVMTGGNVSPDIVNAFEQIQAAGDAGKAEFVSRGSNPGTTIQEHAIWALTTPEAGVTSTLCTVPTGAQGGGESPSTTGGACATPITSLPPWYHATGLTQGPNIVAGDTCNFGGPKNDCYVFTDRATYQYLQSEGVLSNLKVVVNNLNGTNEQKNLLINSFHAYAVNPAAFAGKSDVHINSAGALAFLNWLTSPAGQADVTAYQSGDPGGSSFIGDAAPRLTAMRSALTVTAGKTETISGSLTNKVAGTPPIQAEGITVSSTPAGSSTSTTVATTATDASGNYTATFTPKADATYAVATNQQPITQIEIPSPTLTPQFGDILQPTSTVAGTVNVTGAPKISKLTAKKGVVTVKGTVAPSVTGSGAVLKIYANHSKLAKTEGLKHKATLELKAGAKTFTKKLKLRRGYTWRIDVKYTNSGQISGGYVRAEIGARPLTGRTIHLRRSLLVATVLLTGVLSPLNGARADTSCSSTASLDVHLPDGSIHVVDAQHLCASESVNGAYYSRTSPSATPQDIADVTNGVAVLSFLQQTFATQLGSAPISFIGVVHPDDGSWSTWTSQQAAEPVYQPQSSGGVAVLRINGNQLEYYRPLLADTSDTGAAADAVIAGPGSAIELYVGTGSLLTVTATASAAGEPTSSSAIQVKPEQQVTFTASSTPASSSPTVHWDFGDGQSATGASVTHTFDGTSKSITGDSVVATVDSTDGSAGAAEPIEVTIGTTAEPSPSSSATPVGGGSTTPSSPRPGRSSRPTPHRSSTPSPGSRASHAPSSAPTDAGRATSAPETVASPMPSSSAPATVHLAIGRPPLVAGRVISEGATLLAVSAPQPRSATQTATAPGGRAGTDRRAFTAAGSTAVILLLFAAGAVRERRGQLRRRSVVRPR